MVENKTDKKNKSSKEVKEYTMEEVRQAAKEGLIWLVIDGMVLDVSKWMPLHPGGGMILKNLAGRDASEPFHGFHPSHVEERMRKFQIGVVTDAELTQVEVEFAEMKQQMKDEGMFVIQPWYFLTLFIRIMAMFAFGLWCVFWGKGKSVELQLFGSFMIGFFWQQMSLMAHDTCHNSMSHNRLFDYTFSVTLSSLLGVSPSWWKDSHNIHHVIPNSAVHDPDIQHMPAMAVDNRFFNSLYSLYHFREHTWDALSKFLISYQHWVFLPLMAVARVNLYIQSYLFLFGVMKGQRSKDFRIGGIISLALFWVWYGYTMMQLPTFMTQFLFFLISHSFSGILHVQICISHFSMEVREDIPYLNDDETWVHWQLATTMDVDCSPMMDWFHGGLQYQIEHHLFPRMPRPHLRRCMEEFIVPFCKKHNIRHHKPSFYQATVETILHLKKVAMEARDSNVGDVKLTETPLWEAVNAYG